jgi:hypothetical protein
MVCSFPGASQFETTPAACATVTPAVAVSDGWLLGYEERFA